MVIKSLLMFPSEERRKMVCKIGIKGTGGLASLGISTLFVSFLTANLYKPKEPGSQGAYLMGVLPIDVYGYRQDCQRDF